MIKRLFKNYCKNDDGVALIEGIMVMPIAIFMFVGIFEVGQMLLINQKVYAASHMVGDLLTRKATLDNADLDEAYAAGQMIMGPYDGNNLKLTVVGVRFNASEAPEEIWQENLGGGTGASALHTFANGLGGENEGAIVVDAEYTYQPIFSNIGNLPFIPDSASFAGFDMSETAVLRGRVNSCLSYFDGGTMNAC